MNDLNQTIQTLEQLLLQEQNLTITSRADIGASELRRKELHDHIVELDKSLAELRFRSYNLPDLPDERIMDWAESILSMRNLVVLVLDTTGLDESDDIIRIYARNVDTVLIDQMIKPEHVESANTPYTGILLEELLNAPSLTEVWEEIIKPALAGQFIVSYGLSFVEKMLRGNIRHYGLSRLPYRGECLMNQAKAYFQVSRYESIRLTTACGRIGHEIPSDPPLAQERAAGALELLKAMSQGVISVPAVSKDTDLDELDKEDERAF